MLLRRFITLLLVAILALNLSTVTSAIDEFPQYAITDTHVIIDHVLYEIIDNSIQYEGKKFMVEERTLVSYDENGQQTILFVPTEDKIIKDPILLAKLNAALGVTGLVTRGLPSIPIDLPYSAYVPEGQWYVETPCFNLIQGVYYRRVELKFTGLSIFDSRNFLVYGLFYNAATDSWYSERREVTIGVTSLDNSLSFIDSSASNACMFTMTNLYGNPSPSYTYNVEKYRI